MNRRRFLQTLPMLGVAALGGAAANYWPEQGFRNQCLAALPQDMAQHPVVQRVWAGVDPRLVWDSHTHLVGSGDSGSGAWFSPQMDSLWHPLFSVGDMAEAGLLDHNIVPVLKKVRAHNPLLFDFALKRMLRLQGRSFPASVFETRRFFDRSHA